MGKGELSAARDLFELVFESRKVPCRPIGGSPALDYLFAGDELEIDPFDIIAISGKLASDLLADFGGRSGELGVLFGIHESVINFLRRDFESDGLLN